MKQLVIIVIMLEQKSCVLQGSRVRPMPVIAAGQCTASLKFPRATPFLPTNAGQMRGLVRLSDHNPVLTKLCYNMDDPDKKKKSKSKDKEDSEKPKEKKDKKDKDKDKDGKDKKDKKDKDKEGKDKKDKKADTPAAAPAPRPQPRGPPPKAAQAQSSKGANDYLSGFDIPSSEDDDDDYERSARADGEDDKPLTVAINARDNKKIADKERKANEAAVRAKEDALREDDNVFDVSYAGMGEDAQATATDIKVSTS